MGLFRRKRRGLLDFTGTGTGAGWLKKGQEIRIQVEVVELERQGNLSKIKITNMSGASYHLLDEAKHMIPKWLPTSEVAWLDG